MACLGGGAGGLAISYYTQGTGEHHDNTHEITSTEMRSCTGGDWSQGAGALAVISLGLTHGMEAEVQDSGFYLNAGGAIENMRSGVGVAGAVTLYVQASSSSSDNEARFVNIQMVANRLTCKAATCVSGGVNLFNVLSKFNRTLFHSNESPLTSGAIQSNTNVTLRESNLTNNTGVIWGTANVARLSISTIWMHMSYRRHQSSTLATDTFDYEQFLVTCDAGFEVTESFTDPTVKSNEIMCEKCAVGKYGLSQGVWRDNISQTVCQECPSLNPSEITCQGNVVNSQPGRYSYFKSSQRHNRRGGLMLTELTELGVATCPKQGACANVGHINASCPADMLEECNSRDTAGKCREGYTGMLCASCSDGWFSAKADGLTCKRCPDAGFTVAFAIVNGLGLYLISIGMAKITHEDTGKSGGDRTLEGDSEDRGATVSSSFKILMAHATILTAVIPVEWAYEEVVDDIMAAPQAPSGSISELDLGCVFGYGFTTKVYFNLTYPICVAAMAVLTAFILPKIHAMFTNFSETLKLLSTTGLYLFGANGVAVCAALRSSVALTVSVGPLYDFPLL